MISVEVLVCLSFTRRRNKERCQTVSLSVLVCLLIYQEKEHGRAVKLVDSVGLSFSRIKRNRILCPEVPAYNLLTRITRPKHRSPLCDRPQPSDSPSNQPNCV